MTSKELFIALIHRLQRYDDAAVLHALLQQHADQKELKTSATRIALNSLGGRVERKQVQRSFQRLVDGGYITTRVVQNYRTLITVDSEAVLALLALPVSDLMPGIRTDGFPFLDGLNASHKVKDAADAAIKRMGQKPEDSGASASGQDSGA